MSERTRRIVAWAGLSLDGYTSGPNGPAHDTWLHEQAMREEILAYFEGVWRGADTALTGRTNYEGFHSVWPGITRDPATDPRTRDLGRWLDSVEKVVVSRTLEHAPWENSRIARDLEQEVRALKQAEGRDVLVLNSASVIQALLRADLLDELRFFVAPVLLGGGLRLWPDGIAETSWRLTETTTLAHGSAVGLRYSRR
ncbi:dihydrofolate reductase [Herbihabitans rhizosphaerae]|uniref:Dihydrofolate reductase n=1 Tax=Herbihabitans rhizosphaerae TaxID=1872711 RepID=A0A4Q7KX71_9PSEU|nr:dihydrofolate reductase family protein [Herbihabitans rhizosphaerae]RZS41307.1 dihydrofolate reductase [Herbihabitans rhizosphaerae]